MKIETKYDIGQEVWFEMGGEVKKSIITKIHISSAFIAYDVKLHLTHGLFFEQELFPTKEELLKNL